MKYGNLNGRSDQQKFRIARKILTGHRNRCYLFTFVSDKVTGRGADKCTLASAWRALGDRCLGAQGLIQCLLLRIVELLEDIRWHLRVADVKTIFGVIAFEIAEESIDRKQGLRSLLLGINEKAFELLVFLIKNSGVFSPR